MDPQKQLYQKPLAAFHRFFHLESTGGIILMVVTIVALIIANSPLYHGFEKLLHAEIELGFGNHHFAKPLHFWINDVLMSLFFFVVGLEIKRELIVGELSSVRKAILPIGAAIGGILVPIIIFLVVNWGKPTQNGWGIPMATDIAFAVGVLALLGDKIPTTLKVFLTALAIADDIGGILVISLFYSHGISWAWVALSLGLLGLWILLARAGIKNIGIYLLIGGLFWIVFLQTGIHPTIAGIVYAMIVPVRNRIPVERFLVTIKEMIQKFEDSGELVGKVFTTKPQREALTAIEESTAAIRSPLQRLEHALHPWVVFFIIPVFALANAGIHFEGEIWTSISHPLFWGVFLGLFLGKQIGVFTFSWLLVKTGIAQLYENVSWRHIYGASCLAGIGFTMAIFMSNVSLENPDDLVIAKFAIMAASLLSGVLGYIVLKSTK